jgi:hypothetical protein
MADPKDLHKLSSGRFSTTDKSIKQASTSIAPTFYRMVVLETIVDPEGMSPMRQSYWKNILNVTNYDLRNALPRNTIVAQMILGRSTITNPMFIFPFFPSHLAMPCKPGEMVWAMFEDPNVAKHEVGYWFCRIAEPNFIDDVNHTHHAAQLDMTNVESKKQKHEQNFNPVYQMRNGKPIIALDGARYTQPNSKIIAAGDDAFENLLQEPDGALMMQYEPIPRFKKRPGDLALEGSNNTLIVLGTDRVGPYAVYDQDNTIINDEVSTGEKKGQAGAIDIVAGRGMTPTTGGEHLDVTGIAIPDEIIRSEINKYKPVPQEGDPDFINDRSRILVSQRTEVDTNFKLTQHLADEQGIQDSTTGDAAIVIKSDKIRMVARSDISLIVTDYDTSDGESISSYMSNYKVDNEDVNRWASITIRVNGDIIFTPSATGVVKLGGSDASHAIVCTEFIADNTTNPGTVTALPIGTTGGGFIGTNRGQNKDLEAAQYKRRPDFGKIATKVLVK